MNIEQAGTVPKQEIKVATPPWWLGKKAECPKCHALFTLEANDAPWRYTNFALRCPTRGCGAYIQIRPVFDRTGRIG
jgi:hypothetical protein